MEVLESGHRLLQNGTRQPEEAQELNFEWVPTPRCTAADSKFWPFFNVGLDFITENNKNIYINGWKMIGDELKDEWKSSAILQETCAASAVLATHSPHRSRRCRYGGSRCDCAMDPTLRRTRPVMGSLW